MNVFICTDREIKCSECQEVVDCAGGCGCLRKKNVVPEFCEGCGHELGLDKVIVPADDMSPAIALCPECAKKDEAYTSEGFAHERIDKN
jgi:hypothetical protein